MSEATEKVVIEIDYLYPDDATADILQSMQTRIELLEMKVTDTNAKLDLILEKLG